MLQLNHKMIYEFCFISFIGLNGVIAFKNYEGHHRTGYEHAHPIDENQINVSRKL